MNEIELAMKIAVIVQIIGGFALLIGIVTSIWSLMLQKREVVKQNQRIIDLLMLINQNLGDMNDKKDR